MSAIKNPEASLRLAVAVRYWHAARIVLANQIRPVEYMEPVGHLLCMAVELSLKSFLQNAAIKDSKFHGHDLGKLLRLAVENQFKISQTDANNILVMRASHLEHFHRYGPKNLPSGAFLIQLFDEAIALDSVARIIDEISQEPSTLRKLHQHTHDLDWPITASIPTPITLNELLSDMYRIDEDANNIASIGVPHTPTK